MTERPLDEKYDCQRDVERDPYGAWMAIQSLAALVAAQPVVKPNIGACTIALHGNEITVVFDEREDAERAFNEIEATGRFSALSLPTKETSEC